MRSRTNLIHARDAHVHGRRHRQNLKTLRLYAGRASIPRQGLPMLIAPRQIKAISDAAVGAGPARAWLV
jgi:hypothetical protein